MIFKYSNISTYLSGLCHITGLKSLKINQDFFRKLIFPDELEFLKINDPIKFFLPSLVSDV